MTTANTPQKQRLALCFSLDAECHSKELLEVSERSDCVGCERAQPDFIDFFWPQRTQQQQKALQQDSHNEARFLALCCLQRVGTD